MNYSSKKLANGSVIVSGPAGCGKSRDAKQLAAQFGCKHILDAWDGVTVIPPNTLALTNMPMNAVAALAA